MVAMPASCVSPADDVAYRFRWAPTKAVLGLENARLDSSSLKPKKARMSIQRFLTASLWMLAALHAHGASDGTDSHCVVEKNRTLFNQCDYPVDVGFCVENPQQTKNFFDSSDAFKCPNGGLSTLLPGREEGNVLNGTVHWFACATKHRGAAKWSYVPGSGYRGNCTKDESSTNSGAKPTPPVVASTKEAEVWSEVFECNDWIPDQPGVWKEVDPVTRKEMCKSARSPAAQEVAARAFTERKRAEAQAVQRKRDELARADQRKREEAARSEQQFRTGLQTLNPGQLFARADELSAQGDSARAREVQRALMSRFPDHPLAATAARQMAGESGGSPTGAVEATPRPSGGRLSSPQCEALKQAVIATRIPANAAITASQETVMWMTNAAVQVIDAGCADGTPPQQAAARQQYQQAYTTANQACNQVQAGGRQCVARNHFGPGAAPEAGIRSPYPNIPVGTVPKITSPGAR